MLDSVDAEGVYLERGNEMVDPGVERGDDVGGFGVEIRGLRADPAWIRIR